MTEEQPNEESTPASEGPRAPVRGIQGQGEGLSDPHDDSHRDDDIPILNPSCDANKPAVPGRTKRNSFGDHLHLPAVEVTEGGARLELTVREIHLRHGGLMHGGMLATLLDTVTGYAAYSVVPETSDVLTMQLNLNMTATAKLGETVIATAKVVHAGRRTAVVTGEIRLPDGKLLATGSATMFIVDRIVT